MESGSGNNFSVDLHQHFIKLTNIPTKRGDGSHLFWTESYSEPNLDIKGASIRVVNNIPLKVDLPTCNVDMYFDRHYIQGQKFNGGRWFSMLTSGTHSTELDLESIENCESWIFHIPKKVLWNFF